jgi:CoA:oxalate CoA-transferase
MNLFTSIKILDLSRVFSGPFATRHFADFGAEVIKIEQPHGDDSEHYPPTKDNWSGYYELLNRNKKKLVLDLKNKADLCRFYDLCQSCDVVVENYSPRVVNDLKIDYATLRKVQPKVIYASIRGISDTINRKYYDAIAQAESGLMSLNGIEDDMKNATSIIDAFTGMKLAYAISTALFHRERTGVGSRVVVSMRGSAFDMLEQNLIASSISKSNPAKVGNMDNAIAPFGVFRAHDSNIVLAIGNNAQWTTFVTFLQEKNPSFDEHLFKNNSLRLRNLAMLKKEIEHVFMRCPADEIVSTLARLAIPCAKTHTMQDVLACSENFDNYLLERVRHSAAGEIVVPTGGIFFSGNTKEPYKEAPTRDV